MAGYNVLHPMSWDAVQTTKYQKEGKDVWDTRVLVSGVILAGGKRREDGQPQNNGGGYNQKPQGHSGGYGDDDFPMDFVEAEITAGLPGKQLIDTVGSGVQLG